MVLFNSTVNQDFNPYEGTHIIIDYLTDKVTDFKIVGSDHREFTMDSIFGRDSNKHLSVNLETGLWQDFKYHKQGNFLTLVAALEGLHSVKQAKAFIDKRFNINKLEHLAEFLKRKECIRKNFEKDKVVFDDINLKEKYGIEAISETSNYILAGKAIEFLKGRQLFNFINSFYIATKGHLFGRLIIPYIVNNKIVYFQARRLFEYDNLPKYVNPSSDISGVKSSDILYPTLTPIKNSVIIFEGPLDAFIAQQCYNFPNATAIQGSNLSDSQIRILSHLKDKNIVLAFDNDAVGKAAYKREYFKLKKLGFKSISIFYWPGQYKDLGDYYKNDNTPYDIHQAPLDDFSFSNL